MKNGEENEVTYSEEKTGRKQRKDSKEPFYFEVKYMIVGFGFALFVFPLLYAGGRFVRFLLLILAEVLEVSVVGLGAVVICVGTGFFMMRFSGRLSGWLNRLLRKGIEWLDTEEETEEYDYDWDEEWEEKRRQNIRKDAEGEDTEE